MFQAGINVGPCSDKDTEIHGDDRLPMESEAVDTGCFVSVSSRDAEDRTTVDAGRQTAVARKLSSLLSCLP